MKKNQKPIFYTDSNGLEMMRKIIDIFNYKEKTNVKNGGNFYPFTTLFQ